MGVILLGTQGIAAPVLGQVPKDTGSCTFRAFKVALVGGDRLCIAAGIVMGCMYATLRAAFSAFVGAVAARHRFGIVALCRMFRVMLAQIVSVSGKGHHGAVLEEHTQAQQNAQGFLDSIGSTHIVFLLHGRSGRMPEGIFPYSFSL